MTLADYIVSIEHIEVEIASMSIMQSENLSNSQNIANCVPFVSIKIDDTSDDWDDILCDVYFTAGSPPTVTARRSAGTGTVTVSIFVVEFDGTNVVVQMDTFSMSGLNTTVSIDAVVLAKSFFVACYRNVSGDDDWESSMISGYFSSTTSIYLDRTDSFGTNSGRVYTVEAQGTEFSTEAYSISIGSGAAQGSDTISAVVMASTMLVGLFKTTLSGDDPLYGAVRVWLGDTTTVYAERAGFGVTTTCQGFVIKFTGNESVQHKQTSWTNTDSSKNTEITAIVEVQSILVSATQYGVMECAGTASDDVEGAMRALTFVDSDTVNEIRGPDHLQAGTSNFQVIDFENGGVPPAAEYSGRGIGRGIGRGVMR